MGKFLLTLWPKHSNTLKREKKKKNPERYKKVVKNISKISGLKGIGSILKIIFKALFVWTRKFSFTWEGISSYRFSYLKLDLFFPGSVRTCTVESAI